MEFIGGGNVGAFISSRSSDSRVIVRFHGFGRLGATNIQRFNSPSLYICTLFFTKLYICTLLQNKETLLKTLSIRPN